MCKDYGDSNGSFDRTDKNMRRIREGFESRKMNSKCLCISAATFYWCGLGDVDIHVQTAVESTLVMI